MLPIDGPGVTKSVTDLTSNSLLPAEKRLTVILSVPGVFGAIYCRVGSALANRGSIFPLSASHWNRSSDGSDGGLSNSVFTCAVLPA